jgi:hypothetical protein
MTGEIDGDRPCSTLRETRAEPVVRARVHPPAVHDQDSSSREPLRVPCAQSHTAIEQLVRFRGFPRLAPHMVGAQSMTTVPTREAPACLPALGFL